MTTSSSWGHLDQETRASTPQSTQMIDEEVISQNQRLEVIRQSQVAFLAPAPPLPLLTRDSEADFNEHLNAMHAEDVQAQTLSQELLARHPIQDLTQPPSHLVNGEASHLAESLHLPPPSPPAITATSLSPVPNPREAIITTAEDPRDTIPAPFNYVANSTAAHHSSTATPATPTSPISGSVRSEGARTRNHHAPKQRKSNRHRSSFVKWVRKRFRKQGPWTPACFHDKTAGENAIKRAEDQGL